MHWQGRATRDTARPDDNPKQILHWMYFFGVCARVFVAPQWVQPLQPFTACREYCIPSSGAHKFSTRKWLVLFCCSATAIACHHGEAGGLTPAAANCQRILNKAPEGKEIQAPEHINYVGIGEMQQQMQRLRQGGRSRLPPAFSSVRGHASTRGASVQVAATASQGNAIKLFSPSKVWIGAMATRLAFPCYC